MKHVHVHQVFNRHSPIAKQFNYSRHTRHRHSDLLYGTITPCTGTVATANAAAWSDPDLAMIFKAHSNKIPFTVLLDSGASNCFITSNLCHKLGLKPTHSSIKAVELASGTPGQVLGVVSIPAVHWLSHGESPVVLSTPVPMCYVLQTLVSGVDMIIGQDFMQAKHVTLHMGTSTATIGQSNPILSNPIHLPANHEHLPRSHRV
jgi:hypothetical protein